jgi:predicted dithiol-disulfide oxidoreductase (DUF899 family)
MSEFNDLRRATENERDHLVGKLALLEATTGTTFMEARIMRREIEQMEHRLIWLDRAPRGWFR